jgi:small subunit ribosomal protein S6
MNTTRKYELVYVLAPEVSEEGVTELHAQIEATVARFEGQIEKSENWGRRRLAYEIGPHKEGIYLLEFINGSGELMKEIDRRLRVNEQVLRHLVVRVDEELRAVERARSRRQADAQRRVARGLPAEPPPARREAGELEQDTDEGEEA